MVDKVITGFFAPILTDTGDSACHGPMIRMSICDPKWSGDGAPVIAARDVKALVDTGAENCYIDSQLAKTLSLPQLSEQSYAGSLLNLQAGKAYIGHELFSGDFSPNSFKLLLGWKILQYYTLSLSQKGDRVVLTWAGA